MWPLVAAGTLAAVVAFALGSALRPARPPLGAPGVSLCLVVRDQAERLEGLVADAVALSAALGAHVTDVVVVDDASADGTADILDRLQRRFPAVKTLHWPREAPAAPGAVEAACALCARPWILLARAGGGVLPFPPEPAGRAQAGRLASAQRGGDAP